MSSDFYDIHVRPWLVAGRDLVPHRSFIQPLNAKDTTMTTSKRTALQRLADWDVATREMPKRKWARRVAVVGAANALVLGGAMAYASWSSSGSGSGFAAAGTMGGPTTTNVAYAAFSSGYLYPGGAAGDVKITVNNPNAFPVKVTAVNGNGAITGAGGSGTCTTTGVSFTNQSPSTSNSVAASSSATLTLSGAVLMNNTSDNGCQGALFTIPVTVTLTSG